MALVSPAPTSPMRFGELKASVSRSVNILEPSVSRVIEEKIHVAVGKSVKECKSVLVWALQNSGGKRICIVHVHQPSELIPCMGGKFPASLLTEEEVSAYRESERGEMNQNLDEYLRICERMGVPSEKLSIEMGSIEKGILELVSQHGIKKLVMGAAADKRYSRKMMSIKSKKAMHVRLQAPAFCHITFVCKGFLVHQREAMTDFGESNPRRSLSATPLRNNYVKFTNPAQDLLRRAKSVCFHGNEVKERTSTSSRDVTGLLNPQFRSDAEGSSDECDTISRSSTSRGSVLSTGSSSGTVKCSLPYIFRGFQQDQSLEDPLYDLLKQAMADAAKWKREAFEETVRREKAEKNVVEALRKAKTSESLYVEESRRRKEVQELLEKKKEALEELEQKMISAVELQESYKRERDELQMERDKALKEAEDLKKCRAEASGRHISQFYSEFSLSEIEEGTRKFDPSLKIGEGGYGSIYKCVLRYTVVAVKMPHSDSLQGPSEFQQEVDILSKMRHPNLVTLFGACPEKWALIYEYLPNGSLEDRLNCNDNSPPLSWQNRLRIASELCSVLVFLHSNKPQSIVHGDLKPANILLDAYLVSKLSDFGVSRLLSDDEGFSSNTLCCRTNPKGTFAYMDPEFLATGELTQKSDVYSFGVILLRLLTGKPALGITKEVQYALDKRNLKAVLDPLAGDWPFLLAEQLAHLALRCCELKRKSRPDLASEVWRVLEPLKASFEGSCFLRIGSVGHRQAPPDSICPIFQEVMRDPQVAADGYTYEAEALRGWLDSVQDTSPMTNARRESCNLVPSHTSCSTIQEGLQQQQ
ncbi:hypothetical protein K2173_013371 [Erythroxylum novogranatense]|uniref:RING-type E3 ubiquitin transferase n=1 Tax=Erythroxylum novogranatense TaxID=1862640 RepID=A0AAV8SAA1_9ROSI|nr:hypothetical protein K2173_013371 [Erythroxylum novogranatense]